MAESIDTRLETPSNQLSALSFAATDTVAIKEWASALPLANTQETASRLMMATAEIAQLNATPNAKFEYLEAVRSILHYICARLDRAAQKADADEQHLASAQELLLGLCLGYKSVVLAAIEQRNQTGRGKESRSTRERLTHKDVLPQAMHRLVSDSSRALLRALQLYIAPPANFWWELNELYRVAEHFDITDFRMADDKNHTPHNLSLKGAYLRSLLIASCKPNQLQQQEIVTIFNALEDWGETVNIENNLEHAVFIVDLAANRGPVYAPMASQVHLPRALRTEVLSYEIEAYLKDVESAVPIPDNLSTRLLEHLVEAWSVMRARSFGRLEANTPLRVCVGLRAAHYYLSGGVDFSDQLSNTDALLRREVNPFLDVDFVASKTEDDDPWSQAHDLKVRIPINPNIEEPDAIFLAQRSAAAAEQTSANIEHFETIAVDTSPGGYRINWVDPIPPKTKVGDLITLREEKDSRWCVAIVRWISQHRETTGMGIELLAPRAIPIAIRIVQTKGGHSDYARALLLPEIAAIKQPATIITPSVPYTEQQKVHIQRQGIQSTGQLLQTRLKSESFNQFTFRMLDGYLESARSDSSMDTLSAMTREDTSRGS